MTRLRHLTAIALIIVSGAGIIMAGWSAVQFQLPEKNIFFDDADKIHKSVYTDENIEKLLEQNLRMQEAIFSAQKQGIESIINHQYDLNIHSGKTILITAVFLAGSMFCLVLSFLIFPREITLSNHTLAQLEMILWHGMVIDNDKNKDDEFTVKESAYPVHLCGCSSGDLPVHLCGCNPASIPVHLCKCGCWE